MKSRWITVSLMGLGLAAVACSANKPEEHEQEQKTKVQITADQLPPAVKDTMQKETGSAELTKVEKKTEDDKTCYEAHAMMNGKDYEIEVAADGTLLKLKLETGEKHEEHEGHD